jgi:hypothetical protein
MRSDANRRLTDFRPAKSPLFYRPNPEGPAAREMCADFGRCFAGWTHLRRMGTHGDAWGRMRPAGDRCQIDVRHGGIVSRRPKSSPMPRLIVIRTCKTAAGRT